MPFNYPTVRKENLVEIIHRIKIADPYRWLEDLESDETKQFVQQQQNLTESYLKSNLNDLNNLNRLIKMKLILQVHRIEKRSGNV